MQNKAVNDRILAANQVERELEREESEAGIIADR